MENAMSKEQILTELYELRAGLSAISVEKDSIDNADKLLESKKQKLSGQLKDIDEKKKKEEKVIRDAYALLDNHAKKEQEIHEEYHEDLRKVDVLTDDTKNRYLIGKILLAFLVAAAFFALAGISVFCFVRYQLMNQDMPELFVLLDLLFMIFVFISPVVALAAAGAGVFFFVKIIKNAISDKFSYGRKERKNDIRTAEQNHDQKLAKLQSDCANAPALIESAQNNIVLLDNKTAQVNDKIALAAADHNSTVTAHVNSCTAIDKFIRQKYSPILSESDWHSLDLIIYYLETNRADTVKEALQLADKQRQNDEIVIAIKGAANAITDTIQGGFLQLRADMVKCFSIMSNQIQIQIIAEQQAAQNSRLINAIDNMSSSIVGVTSAISVQNALQQKANASSEQLMSDMKYMRTLAENEEVRRRNTF